MSEYTSQYIRVVRILQDAGSQWVPITRFLEAGITRFGARIWEMRQAGHVVEMREERKGKRRHVSYRLVLGQGKLF